MAITANRIEIPYPTDGAPALSLRLGPCRVSLSASDGPAWVTGTYDDPSGMLPLDSHVDGPRAQLSQRFDLTSAFDLTRAPRLDLAFGRARPFALTIEAGASENTFELGGIPLTALTVKVGAGKYDVDFSSPNPVAMSMLELSAGAGAVEARHLANANAVEIRSSGGVGKCVLDFSGQLVRDTHARIDAGLAGIELVIPAEMPARVALKAVAASKDIAAVFTRHGDTVFTESALAGKTPQLIIDLSIAFGSLMIRAA